MLTLLAVLLGAVVPGLCVGSALLRPETAREHPAALVASWWASGATVPLLASGVLERTAGITQVSAWTACGVLAAGSLSLLALRRTRAVLADGTRPAARYALGVAAVAAATSWPLGWLVLRTSWAPLGSTPWYYAGLADQVAAAGRVPAASVEWGVTVPFLDDYHLFTTVTAVLLDQSGGDDVAVLQALTLLAVVALAVAAAVLAAALGAGQLASLAAVPVALASGVGASRLSAYRPEAAALGLTLLVVALFVTWLRTGDRGTVLLVGLVSAAVSQVHGIAMLTAGVLLVAAGAALAPHRQFRSHVARCALAAGAAAVAVLLAAVLVGQASGAVHVGQLADVGGAADPTWEFYRAINGAPSSEPPTSAELVRHNVGRIFAGTGAWLLPVLAVALLLLLVALRAPALETDEARRRREHAREALLFGLVALTGLACAAAFFAWGWSSYVPRRTGAQRLVLESSVLIGPLVACGLGAGVRWPPGWPRRRRPPGSSGSAGSSGSSGWGRLATALAVAGLCVGGLLNVLDLERTYSQQRPTADDVAALRGLRLGPDDVVLVNAYTEGFVHQVSGAVALLEGRAPYTFPDLLARSNALLRQAQRFYADPDAHASFLARNQVDYVAVTRRRAFALASDNVFRAPPRVAPLRRCSGLRPELEGPRLWVFRVVSPTCRGEVP